MRPKKDAARMLQKKRQKKAEKGTSTHRASGYDDEYGYQYDDEYDYDCGGGYRTEIAPLTVAAKDKSQLSIVSASVDMKTLDMNSIMTLDSSDAGMHGSEEPHELKAAAFTVQFDSDLVLGIQARF